MTHKPAECTGPFSDARDCPVHGPEIRARQEAYVSPREAALRTRLEQVERDLRREAALWPKTETGQQVGRMLFARADELRAALTGTDK
jgi:hypothetical protein